MYFLEVTPSKIVPPATGQKSFIFNWLNSVQFFILFSTNFGAPFWNEPINKWKKVYKPSAYYIDH